MYCAVNYWWSHKRKTKGSLMIAFLLIFLHAKYCTWRYCWHNSMNSHTNWEDSSFWVLLMSSICQKAFIASVCCRDFKIIIRYPDTNNELCRTKLDLLAAHCCYIHANYVCQYVLHFFVEFHESSIISLEDEAFIFQCWCCYPKNCWLVSP